MHPSTPSLQTLYQSRVIAGDLRPDVAQEEALRLLQELLNRLDGYCPKSGGWLTASMRFIKSKMDPRFRGNDGSVPQGIYLYGDVGRGKSMLMDMVYEHAHVARKRRVHFHHFMLEVHDRLHTYQLQGDAVDGVLPELARHIAAETWLLCFDEFHINNIADAMILGRLFAALFKAGVVVFVTSNSAPDELYKNGLQRDRFLPSIEIIKHHMRVHCLAGAVDHRYEYLRGLDNYFTPLGKATTEKLRHIFNDLTNDAKLEAVHLPVQGRPLIVPYAAKGVALFRFDELCGQPLGAADYLAIATCFHTVMLDAVPQLSAEQRNETMRFTTLVDALYESKTQLFIAAAVAPEDLCLSGDLSFAFKRTVSRLIEMQSEAYRRLPHLGG